MSNIGNESQLTVPNIIENTTFEISTEYIQEARASATMLDLFRQ